MIAFMLVSRIIIPFQHIHSPLSSAIHYIDFSPLASKPTETLGTLFRHLFVLARWHSPAVLVFDNLDKVCAAEVEHADSFRQRHITELFLMQYSSNERLAPSNFRGIMLLATAESQTSVHALLHTLHVFQDVASISPPGRAARKEVCSFHEYRCRVRLKGLE